MQLAEMDSFRFRHAAEACRSPPAANYEYIIFYMYSILCKSLILESKSKGAQRLTRQLVSFA